MIPIDIILKHEKLRTAFTAGDILSAVKWVERKFDILLWNDRFDWFDDVSSSKLASKEFPC